MISHHLKEKVKKYFDDLYPLQIIKREFSQINQLEDQIQERRKEIIDKLDWRSIFVRSLEVSEIYKKYFSHKFLSTHGIQLLKSWNSDFDCGDFWSECELENSQEIRLVLEFVPCSIVEGKIISDIILFLKKKIPGSPKLEEIQLNVISYFEIKIILSPNHIRSLMLYQSYTNPWDNCYRFSEILHDLIVSGINKQQIMKALELEYVDQFRNVAMIKQSEIKLFTLTLNNIVEKELKKKIMKSAIRDKLKSFWLSKLDGLEEVIGEIMKVYPLKNRSFENHFKILYQNLSMFIDGIDNDQSKTLLKEITQEAYDQILIPMIKRS